MNLFFIKIFLSQIQYECDILYNYVFKPKRMHKNKLNRKLMCNIKDIQYFLLIS